jgi:hypothetical protein
MIDVDKPLTFEPDHRFRCELAHRYAFPGRNTPQFFTLTETAQLTGYIYPRQFLDRHSATSNRTIEI